MRGLLHPLDIPSGKWESISMDFIVGLPRQWGHDSVWVIVDRFTKMTRFIPTKSDVKTLELARLFVENLYRLYGDIVSDRDRKFNSHFWRAVFKRLDTKLSMSTAEHPQMDPQTERVNEILEDMLQAYVSKRQTNWKEYLPIVEFAYNSAKHSSTGYSPFMLMDGFQPRAPYAVGLQKEKVQAAKDFLEDMNEMLKLAKDNIKKAQDRARTYTDPHRRPLTFEKGEQVYLKVLETSETMKAGPCPKLSPRYYGPFTILKRVGDMAYKLQLPETSGIHPVFHVSKLKKKLGQSDNLIQDD